MYIRNSLIIPSCLLVCSVVWVASSDAATEQKGVQQVGMPGSSNVESQGLNSASDDEDIREELRESARTGEFKGKVHVCYHLAMAGKWRWWDRFSRIWAICLAILALFGQLMFVSEAKAPLDKKASRLVRFVSWTKQVIQSKLAWAILGLLAVTFAIVLNVTPYNEWYHNHSSLRGSWDALKVDWSKAHRDSNTMSVSELRYLVDGLEARQLGIEQNEPPDHDRELLMECYRTEYGYAEMERTAQQSSQGEADLPIE